MFADLLIGLAKARIAFQLLGIAMLFGVTLPWWDRLAVFALIVSVLLFDSAVDAHLHRTKAPPRYDTAA